MDTAFYQGPATEKEASPQLRLFDIRDLAEVTYESVAGDEAQVAVVVPLYNYEKTIAECLDSVAEQDLEHLSVIVVDDASTDRGGKRAATVLAGYQGRFATAKVVSHRRNQGLSMARNSGLLWSSEPYVFMLDADNRLKRPCLSRLVEALETAEAAFAYAQLRLFGEAEGLGLADVWDPSRLREGNYIDAMALIRRDCLIKAGGYATLANEYGWEDYDLWCRFAELGYNGIFLPEILGDYRVHKSSMLRAHTAKNEGVLRAELAMRHPRIFANSALIEPDFETYR
jgi:glycosyltransferase involved in cell wall biosynthesis